MVDSSDVVGRIGYQPRDGFLPPGSDQARANGCICPVLDNNHGRFPVAPADADFPDGKWWTRQDCPLHWNDVDAGGR